MNIINAIPMQEIIEIMRPYSIFGVPYKAAIFGEIMSEGALPSEKP